MKKNFTNYILLGFIAFIVAIFALTVDGTHDLDAFAMIATLIEIIGVVGVISILEEYGED